MSNINNNTTNLENILDTIDDIAGSPILLWTNPSPTSSFAAQTVTLPTGYDGYLVEVRAYFYYSAAGGMVTQYGIGYVAVGGQGIAAVNSGSYNTNASGLIGRGLQGLANGITFSNGDGENYNSSGTVAQPTRIWGVKFTL